ncbi:toxin-antitoxin system YwqK family antitoxin, partial [Morganella sp. EGD-HP17]|uniref:toxin-antitoxin system YwqK family antitoxin n=1 Tax=Morganella sp. EGD-HP17 TaxID=1435146 RepID=UPI000446CEF2
TVYSVVDLSKKTRCGAARAVISPASLKLSEEDFDKQWQELRKNTGQERFYKVTYGKCGDDGPMITKIVDCSEGACGKEYRADTGKMWLNTWSWGGDNIPMTLNGQYTSAESKSSAQYFIELPLKEVPEKNAWKVKIYYTENPDVIALDTYVDNADFLLGKFILDYKAYYLSGNLYEEGAFDRQGESQGKATHYYDSPGKIRMISHDQNGEAHGENVFYNENGTLKEKKQFLRGKDVTKDGIIFGPEGQILARYSYNSSGQKEGKWVQYYADGILKNRENYEKGILIGSSEDYWPNGKIKLKETYKNGRKVAETEWYKNGQKMSVSFYNDKQQRIGTHSSWYENGRLHREERYYADGKQASVELWNSDGRPSLRETFDSLGSRHSSEHWFDNGKLRSRAIYQNKQQVSEEIWFDNGQLNERVRWSNGHRKDHETWRKDGTRQEKVLYNKRGGITLIEEYDQKGKLEKHYKYN